MASSKSPKSILTSQVIDELKAAFPKAEELSKLPIVESVILAILRENRSLQDSLRALNQFRATYFDLNELRVSELREIQAIIGNVPDSELRARAIRKFLKQIFQKNYKYDIDGIAKKTFKEAKDDLKDYDALASDFIMAQAQVQTLGGHAFPVDERILLMAKRLGLVEQNADHATLRGILEKNIPKAQIHLAIGLIEEFVDSICTLTDPKCPVCRFKSVCPAYEAMLNPPKVKAKEEPKKLDKPGSRPTPEKPSKSVKAIPGSSKPKSLAGQASDAPAASAEKPLKDGGSPKAASKPVPKKAASGSDSKTSAPKPNAPAKSAAEKTKESAKSVSPSKLTSGATKPIEKPESAKSAANAKPPVKKAQASAKSTKSVPKKSK